MLDGRNGKGGSALTSLDLNTPPDDPYFADRRGHGPASSGKLFGYDCQVHARRRAASSGDAYRRCRPVSHNRRLSFCSAPLVHRVSGEAVPAPRSLRTRVRIPYGPSFRAWFTRKTADSACQTCLGCQDMRVACVHICVHSFDRFRSSHRGHADNYLQSASSGR